jgi:hypothetical protein
VTAEGRGPDTKRELVEQYEPQLVEAWQELEEAHHGLWGMQGYDGSTATELLNVAEEKARDYVIVLRRVGQGTKQRSVIPKSA